MAVLVEALLRSFFATVAELIPADTDPAALQNLHAEARTLLIHARQCDINVRTSLNERDRQIEANRRMHYELRDLENAGLMVP